MSSEYLTEERRIEINHFVRREVADDLVKQGVRVICICEGGNVRSWAMSDLFNEESINAIFLGGGVKGLKGLSDIDRESFSTNIALIPNVIVCLDGFEIDYYKKQIDLLNSKRSKPAIINDRLSAMPILIAKILE